MASFGASGVNTTRCPDFSLTVTQAQRLWGLDRVACDTVLSALVDVKFLRRNRDGAYVRRS
jgi:hypothetical protein